jgi:Tfp pilus assembly protein PilW
VRKTHSSFLASFTLVELMVGLTLSAAVMAAVLSSYLYLARGLARLANQQVLESEARRTLGYFTRDVQMATGLTTISTAPKSPAANRVDLLVPTTSGTNTITYYYNTAPSAASVTINGINVSMAANSLTRCVYDGSAVTSLVLLRLRNINNTSVSARTDVTIRYYDVASSEYTVAAYTVPFTDYLPGIKQLRIDFSSANGNDPNDLATAQSATCSVVSNRIILRNKALLP